MVAFLLLSMLTLAFNIQQVKASGTIYIRADGSIDPPTANITSADNVTYYFTDNNYDTIVVARSNIIVDGNGYTLQGTTGSGGFSLSDVSNVTIKNTNITVGEWVEYEHPAGFELVNANHCIFFGNNITNFRYGVMTYSDSSINNKFYHNNFTNNRLQVNIASHIVNFWDNDYPSGGNYWSHLTEVDYFSGPNQDQPGSDGIGDIPYLITRVGTTTNITNIDRYPLGGTSECVGTHDVAVTNITPCKTIVGQNYSVSINVTVENQGEFPETFGVVTPYSDGVAIPSSVRWQAFWSMGDASRDGYIDEVDADLLMDAWFSTPSDPNWNSDCDFNEDLTVDAKDYDTLVFHIYFNIWAYCGLPLPLRGTQRGVRLFPGNQTTLTFTWNTTGFAKGKYTISAYAWPVQGETDTADNNCTNGVVTVSWLGDLDGDFDVDEDDLWTFCGAFIDYYKIHVKDPNCDFDDNCKIDEDDLWTMCTGFLFYWKQH